MTSRSIVFAEPVRTAIGTFGGTLKEIPAPNLGAVAVGAAVARAKLRPEEVETVVMGNVVQAGTKMNLPGRLPSMLGCRSPSRRSRSIGFAAREPKP